MGGEKKLLAYLKAQKVKAKVIKHAVAYTAQELAAQQHIPGKQVVKSVLIRTAKDTYVLAVLPAVYLIDFKKLKKVVKSSQAKLAAEKEIKKVAPDYEIGAMPPFGGLFGIDTYIEKTLSEDKEVVFNAGSHKQMLKMSYKDLEKLACPKKIALFGKHISKA